MFNTASRNYVLTGAYPEKQFVKESWLDRMGIIAFGKMVKGNRSDLSQYKKFARKVERLGKKLAKLPDEELVDRVNKLRIELRLKGFQNKKLSIMSFALVRELSARKLGMRHYKVQIMGALVMLKGMIAEMETGEGKTLTATLTAATVALSGIPVHVITVNDYLAKRDAELMKPLYDALGLSVGIILQDMSPEERKNAYANDITYCTNNELTFDYLKDQIVIGSNPNRIRMLLERVYGSHGKSSNLLLRGLHFAIIDEADSVLIDEARTPLIISNPVSQEGEERVYQQALELAGKLQEDKHYQIDTRERQIYFTDSGKDELRELTEELDGIWRGRQRREELTLKALSALLLFHKDKHYIINDGKVQIVDEFTGRVMGDRSWEQGLHQMIETKEGVELTGQRETLARISYQRFFRKYLYLSGMTGTASEVASELWAVYRLFTVKVPTHARNKRKYQHKRVYANANEKWKAVVRRIETIHKTQRPILVGTRSVEDSELLSNLLTEKNLPHRVLNARQDKEEADIISDAGTKGKITVATNMAGRGTDIKLQDGISTIGGLHVILTERHESKRIDRQLFGRCARQGDHGSVDEILSLEDEIASVYVNKLLKALSYGGMKIKIPFSTLLGRFCLRYGQKQAENRNSAIRQELLKADEKQDTALAFTGKL